jgi:hypothetical protein
MFYADLRKVGLTGNYHAMLNSDVMGHDPDPKKLMALADQEIIRRVAEMSAAYRILQARVTGKPEPNPTAQRPQLRSAPKSTEARREDRRPQRAGVGHVPSLLEGGFPKVTESKPGPTLPL